MSRRKPESSKKKQSARKTGKRKQSIRKSAAKQANVHAGTPKKTASAKAPPKKKRTPKAAAPLWPRLDKFTGKANKFTPIKNEAIRWNFYKDGELFATYQLLLSYTFARKKKDEPFIVKESLDVLAIHRGVTKKTLGKHIRDLVALSLVRKRKGNRFNKNLHGNSEVFELLPMPEWVIKMNHWRSELVVEKANDPQNKERIEALESVLEQLNNKLVKMLPSRKEVKKKRVRKKGKID